MAQKDIAGAVGGSAITRAYRRYALAVLVLGYTSSHIDRNIVGILVEPIKNDLGVSDTAMGFLSGIAFAVFYATLGLPIAIWADRNNRRNIIALSVAIWSGMTALCGLASNFLQLALARIGVGIGEAGSSPPSHSMIADLYSAEERSGAMAIYSLGVYFGIMIGFFIGGWVAEWWGWRAAFLIVGLPGLLIALLVRYTLIEPPRGHADGVTAAPVEPLDVGKFIAQISSGFAQLWNNATNRHVVLGITLVSFIGYGAIAWGPAFLIRNHGMTPGQVGTFLGPIVGVAGGLGAFLGGRLADMLAKRDRRWNAWIIVAAKLIAIPFIVAFYLVEETKLALLIYLPVSFLNAFYLGPSFAMIQSLTPLKMRALASAIMLFVLNFIGLGFGPQLVGILSDALRDTWGNESLRYALLFTTPIHLWGAWHYFLAGRALGRAPTANASA